MSEKLILDGTKLAWHKERVEAWLKGERIAPITIDWALTRACNYHCTYCYGPLQENKGKPLTKDVIFRFLDDAAEIGTKAISFVSDGESTCSPHLYEAVLHGKANGLDIALGTNGSLLTSEGIERILPALTYLRFNTSAADEARYLEIHVCTKRDFNSAFENVRKAVEIKRKKGLETTIGMQMVLRPEFSDQILPLAILGKELGVDYLVLKHCSDDELGSLKTDYPAYVREKMIDLLKQAEEMSIPEYQVSAKWSKILSQGKRDYTKCYGAAFIMQFSGSGLVAPCGPLFGERYKRYHIGNIADTPFKQIWQGDRYKEVLDFIASEKFDARNMCGTLCLQEKVNQYLNKIKNGEIQLETPKGNPPRHINFI